MDPAKHTIRDIRGQMKKRYVGEIYDSYIPVVWFNVQLTALRLQRESEADNRDVSLSTFHDGGVIPRRMGTCVYFTHLIRDHFGNTLK